MSTKKLNRRDFLRLSALGASGALLAACGAEEVTREIEKEIEVTRLVTEKETVVVEGETVEVTKIVEKMVTAEAPPAEVVELEWIQHVVTGMEKLHTLADDFSALHPTIDIDFTGLPHQQRLPVLTPRFAAGDPPDLTLGDGIFPWTQEGQMVDLQPYIKADGINLEERLIPQLQSIVVTEPPPRALYGLTHYVAGWLLGYNKDRFDEYDVPYPKPGWTVHDLQEAAITLTRDKDDRSPRDEGFDPKNLDKIGIYIGSFAYWSRYMQAFGGSLWSEDWMTCTMDQGGAMEAIKFLTELACTYRAHINQGGLGDLFTGISGPLISGKCAMAEWGTWKISTWGEIEDFDWDLAACAAGPDPENKHASRVAGNTIGMTKARPHHDACWEFIKYLVFNEDAQAQMAAIDQPALDTVRLREDVLESQLGKRGPSMEGLKWTLGEMYEYTHDEWNSNSNRVFEWRPIFEDLATTLTVFCEEDIEGLVKDAASEVTKILQRED